METKECTHSERINRLETKHAVNDIHLKNTADRLAAIEDTLKWIMRLIIGGLLMAILGFVFQGGLIK